MLQFIFYLLVLTIGIGIGIWIESFSTKDKLEIYQEVMTNQEERIIRYKELNYFIEKENARMECQHKENVKELVEDNINLRKKLNNAQR